MTASFDQALDEVAKVADAVLFEGYLLYPYRASAQKNQLRWQFGALTPRAWAERAAENWASHTECLFEPGAEDAVLRVRLRFLRLQQRQVQRVSVDGSADGGYTDTDRLTVHDAAGAETLHLPWDEGLPEVVDADVAVTELAAGREIPVELPAARSEEPITDADGTVVGRVVRRSWPVSARVVVDTEPVPGPYGALRLRLRVENTGMEGERDALVADSTGPDAEQGTARDAPLRHSLIAAHTVLALSDGVFLSMTDPPEWAKPAVAACVNTHVWPVLAGDPDRPRAVLSSPIILADFPEIAPESPNQLFDGLENDEILTLRTMVLTDEEKREARATDPRAATLVDAVDSMPPEIFERLHGAIRSMSGPGTGPTGWSEAGAAALTDPTPPGPDAGASALSFDGVPTFGQVLDQVPVYSDETGGKPWWDPGEDASVDPDTDWVLVGERRVAKGTRVLLHPSGRADAQDLFLIGRPALVEAVLHDVDGDVHLAVSLTDDPAAEFQAAHGRFRYFRPDEIEVELP
jgi:hypothetical protein